MQLCFDRFKVQISPGPMDVGQMQRRFVEYTTSLFQEGFLDEQFTQLQQLQDESNPEFVVEVVSLFFEDAEKILNDLSKTLDQHPTDFAKVDAHVHQFKGSSSSIGAHRVKDVCMTFRVFCEERNKEGLIYLATLWYLADLDLLSGLWLPFADVFNVYSK